MCKIDLFNKLIFSNLKTPQHILDIGSINIINNSTQIKYTIQTLNDITIKRKTSKNIESKCNSLGLTGKSDPIRCY